MAINVMNISTSETKMLRKSGWISVNPDNSVTWTAKHHTHAGAFAGVRSAARNGNLYMVKGKLVVND